jgi:hypothetical protein
MTGPRGGNIDIVYIAGFGRSGSTILGNVLGQLDGFAHVGEVRQIWRALQNPLAMCGCGVRLNECLFWRNVVHDAFGETPIDADAIREKVHSSTNMRHLPGLLWRRDRMRRGALAESLVASEKLYEAMWRVSGERTLIDSSKLPSYGIAIKRMHGVKVYMLHLVRDPRATAYSWWRQKYQPDGRAAFVPKKSAQSSLIWMTWNTAIEAVKSQTDGYLRIRYEDFVSDPSTEIRRILAMLGREAIDLPMVANQEVFLRPQHTIAGNPSRFHVGRVEIQPDDAWKREMATGSKFAVTALTGPLLVKYGYPITA